MSVRAIRVLIVSGVCRAHHTPDVTFRATSHRAAAVRRVVEQALERFGRIDNPRNCEASHAPTP